MPASNGNALATRMLIGLVTAFILGGVGVAVVAGQQDTRIKHVETTLEKREPIVSLVPIIMDRQERIIDDIKDLRDQMETDHDEVMDAIRGGG